MDDEDATRSSSSSTQHRHRAESLHMASKKQGSRAAGRQELLE